MNKTALIIGLASLLHACSNKDNPMPSQADMSAVRAKLAFTCTHEADYLPPLEPEADQLFKYGRYLEKLDGPKDFNTVARYYRIAAAWGHYKANHNLQLLVSEGSASSPDPAKETIDLAAQLVKAGVPGGYYDMGHYLELGYGVKQDNKLSLRYFRKGADLGSPEALAYVGKQLAPLDKAPEIARQMRQCATNQGDGEVASTLGIDLQIQERYPEAVKAFQKGVEAGNTMSTSFLEGGFKAPPPSDLDYLELPSDLERSKRYRAILEFLRANDGRNPKVPDIDQIVPLPPAKLPPWDGTFHWQKEQDAAVPPQKPSDDLIERLSKAKNLDPATGLPLSKSASKTSPAERLPLGTLARTGERCPEDGIWCLPHIARVNANATQRVSKGDVMPSYVLNNPRPIPGLDRLLGMREHVEVVEWQLVSYTAPSASTRAA
jgi:hypothetical protein